MLRLLVLVVLAGLSIGQAPTRGGVQARPPARKVIEVGYDTPTPDFLRAHWRQMDAQGFDGLVVKLNAGVTVFNTVAYPDAAFVADRRDLAATPLVRLRDNFLMLQTQSEAGWDWYDDADWAATRRNLTNFARTVREGRLRGILFDAEAYGLSPWRYRAADYGGRSFEQVRVQVRARGAQFMRALEAEAPGLRLLCLYLMGMVRDESGLPPEARNYALLGAFVDGWLDGATDQARIIDGNESAYYYTDAANFDAARNWVRGARTLVSARNWGRYGRQLQVGSAVYLDGVLDLWRSPRFFGHHLASDRERMQLLEHNLYQALRTSDEYVWVWNENMDWWGSRGQGVRVPAGLPEAMRRARARLGAGQPLGFDIGPAVAVARPAFDARVRVTGRVTRPGGEGVWAYLDSGQPVGGEDASCQVYNGYGDYDCVFVQGWSGTVRPSAAGLRFTPGQRRYDRLNAGLEQQDYRAGP